MKLVKENLYWFVPGFVLWLVCLMFFPQLWAIITLLLGVHQMISCSKAAKVATKLFLRRTNK
jgi:hypothetical protein